MLMYFFAGCFLNLTLCMTKLRVLVVLYVPDLMDISNILKDFGWFLFRGFVWKIIFWHGEINI